MSFFSASETADLDGEITDFIDEGTLITRVSHTAANGALGQTDSLTDGTTFRGFIGTRTVTERTTGNALIQTTELLLTTAATVSLDTGDIVKADGLYYEVGGLIGGDTHFAAVATYRVVRADVGA